ncbi:hypothetical protein [Proteiniphilum sp. UBA5510]|jgi:hypothetical protein|uniref:hypothetical protein n=1 Tax=Proteiniphilum sp. UBA5510 TaxID=1947286 RepID=UPI002579FDFD|nr:hypothetical protein [Proteiniphilum sp. UBA5510]
MENIITEVVEVTRANGLTVQSATRVSSTYARIVFKNDISSTITDYVNVSDAAVLGITISSFSLSVPAKSTKSYDVYVGAYDNVWLLTESHGKFNIIDL